MKQRLLLFTFFLVLAAGAPLSSQDADARAGIAVMALQNGGSYGQDAEDFAAMRVGLQQMLLVELNQNSALRIVERSQLRQLLAEQQLLEDSLVTPQTAARVGKLVGARYMVLGSFIDLFGDFHLNARVVDTETGEIVVTKRVRDEKGNIYPLVVELAGELTDAVDLPSLPTEIREARESREIPNDAVHLLSRAVHQEDSGDDDEAIETYRRVIKEFPQITEAKEALQQLERR